MNHSSRSQREAYSRRRPMPQRVREDRQETEGRKRSLREAPSVNNSEGLDEDDPMPVKYDAYVRLRRR